MNRTQDRLSFVAGVMLTCLGVLAVGGAAGLAQAGDRLVGAWRLNASKSTFSPGPAYESSAMKVELVGDRRKITMDAVLASGQSVHYEFTAAYDGKDYPLTGLLTADTVALRRVDANTVERVHKSGGKVVATFVTAVSPDGLRQTTTQKGTNVQGEPVNNTLVYEKQ